MWEGYHITFAKNVESILRHGLRASKGGCDGPGVYIWVGPIKKAIRNADIDLSDNHYEMTPEEYDAFCGTLAVIKAAWPKDAVVSAEWEDYIVLQDPVPPERVEYAGSFLELAEKFAKEGDVL